jgi:UDP-N-acetylmuramate dehydrogenase
MKIQENVLLAPYTTFRIGGAARFFMQAQSVVDIQEAIAFAEQKDQKKILILGGGSNIVVSDNGFDGLVIKNELRGISEEKVDDIFGAELGQSFVRIVAAAGESWDDLVKYTVEEKGLYGLENLSFIPGTVGAAPVQNIGAYGAEAKNTIEWVEVYNPTTKKIEQLSTIECQFGYRDSIFKRERENNVILRVAFLLQKSGRLFLEYKDVKNYFAGRRNVPTLREVREAIIKIRIYKFPDPSKMGSAGSFFKNVVMPRTDYQKLLKKYPSAPAFSVDAYRSKSEDPSVKVPTAWILDKVCGFKGLRHGEVGLFERQPLVLVNFGKATAQEVKNLSDEIINSVKEKTDIVIYPEVRFVG